MKRIAVLSDLHLGDPASVLEGRAGESQRGPGTHAAGLSGPVVEPDLSWFESALRRKGLKKVDYLILAGDALDFSVSFKRSYSVARRFFTALRKLDMVEEIVYIPGNHDKDVWDSVQKEVNVFMRVRSGRDPAGFPYEQPGIIDVSGDGVLNLPGVNYATGRKRKKQYGELFLEGLFPRNEHIPVSVVYPNLYVILPRHQAGWILVTHGHLFELAWVLMTEIFGKHLEWATDDPPKGGLKWLEKCNIPANSLICTGLGQGGPSTRLIRRVERELRQRKFSEIGKVVGTFFGWFDDHLRFGFPLEVAQDVFLGIAQKLILQHIKKVKPSRGSKTFLDDRKELVAKFLDATRLTMSAMKVEGFIPEHLGEYPDCVIFGHTHLPFLAGEPQTLDVIVPDGTERRVEFLNTGSFLRGETAGMIFIDEKGECSSVRVDFASAHA